MHLAFKAQKGLFVHFNGRSELHGEDREPAGDIKLRATIENKVLDQLHGTLKNALFFHDTANPGADLADKAMEENRDYLPHRRFPELMPIKWSGEMEGAKLTIRVAGKRTPIVLPEAKVGKLEITPKDGGVCEIVFRAQCKPDEEAAGKLYQLIQKEVEFDLEPKVEEQAPLADTVPAAAP